VLTITDERPRIWIDADACPRDAKELLFKASRKRLVRLVLVANQPMRAPNSERIETIQVGQGANLADAKIVELVSTGDLVITADIPLAGDAIAAGATVLTPHGEELTQHSISERLTARNLLDQLRGSGEITGGPAPYSDRQRIAFANQLDRWLTRNKF